MPSKVPPPGPLPPRLFSVTFAVSMVMSKALPLHRSQGLGAGVPDGAAVPVGDGEGGRDDGAITGGAEIVGAAVEGAAVVGQLVGASVGAGVGVPVGRPDGAAVEGVAVGAAVLGDAEGATVLVTRVATSHTLS